MTTLGLLLRIAITTLYLAVALHAVGRRGWQAIRPLDLMMAFMLGNVGRGIIIGSISVIPGVFALGTLVTLHLCSDTLFRYSTPLRYLGWGAPALLIRHGKIQRQALAQEGVREQDVFAMMRHAGIARLADVHELRLAADGQVVLIRAEAQRPLTATEIADLSAKEDTIWRRAA